MQDPGKIAVIDNYSQFAERLRKMLPSARVERLSSIDHVLEGIESENFSALLITRSVIRGGEIHGFELLDVITAKSPATQVIFLAEKKDIRPVMRALKQGAYQYARLPIGDDELKLLLEAAVERSRRFLAPSSPIPKGGARQLDQLIGGSLPMQEVYRQIRQAAATDMPVLITGETGTGKDLTAQAIHNQSDRKDGPYIPVNLGALPTELVASELFGHEKGAYTGAVDQYEGKFELANNGTVFLDEISSIDEKIQVTLLRLIEQKKFHRLGGRDAVSSNARLITATNEDLAEAIEKGYFREDLYYRLDVFRIAVPPLRDRKGDIPMLIDEFIKRYNQSFHKDILGIAPECISLFEAYNWPGNVRELKNVIQRAVLVCQGDVILPEHLPPRFKPGKGGRPKVTFEIGATLEEVEREMILRTLAATRNNRKRAAEVLGISRRALYNKLDRYGLK